MSLAVSIFGVVDIRNKPRSRSNNEVEILGKETKDRGVIKAKGAEVAQTKGYP